MSDATILTSSDGDKSVNAAMIVEVPAGDGCPGCHG